MSILIMSKVFYTDFPQLPSRSIKIKDSNNKRVVNVSPHVSKIVMLAISDSADDFGQNSWNSIDRLTTKTNLNRRTVIRTIRVLANNGYLTINSLSEYGTNNIEINLSKLGDLPKKRAKVGRPVNDEEIKTSGSESKTSGSESETSGSEPPDSSLTIVNHNAQEKLQEEHSSPAKKNGDNMRTKEEIMKSTEDALFRSFTMQKGDYAHYPERIRPVVEKMEKYWNFVAPTRKGKNFSFWIQSCEEILDSCAEFGVEVLDKLHEDWILYLTSNGGHPPYTVSSPKSLVSAVLGKTALMRGGSNASLWKTNGKHTQSRLDV